MFKPEEEKQLKNIIIVGTNNIQKSDLISFKKSMTKYSVCNMKYIDINNDIINSQINIKREEAIKIKNKLGMISKDWLNKYENEIPSVIIQIIDISNSTLENKEPLLISEEILLEIAKIKSAFMTSNYILIIKDICNLYKSNNDIIIKNNIINNLKDVKDKCIIIINDTNQFDKKEFIDKLCDLVKEEINTFFLLKKNKYHYKLDQCNIKKEIEFSIKYLIKLFTFSYMTHKDNINYFYLFKVNLYLRQKLDKNNNKFISYINNDNNNINNEKKEFLYKIISYFEIKNVADYIVYYLCMKKNMKEIEINKLIYSHISYYNIYNFLKINNNKNIINNNNDDDNIDINFYYKYLFIFDSIWKFTWYKYNEIIINNKDKNSLKDNNFNYNITFDKNVSDFYVLNNLLRLYNFMIKEKNFIKNNIINKYKNYKYNKKDNKFIEKLPSYFELDKNNKEIKELNLEESIILYINNIILNNIDILDINIIYKKLQYFFYSQKYNSYLFNIIIKFNLIDKNNQNNKEIFIKNTLNYLNDYKLIKFPKVYEDYLEKTFKIFIKENIGDNLVNNKNKLELIIKYLDITKKNKFSNEETNLINKIINEKNENEKGFNINLNNKYNNFIDFKIIYNNETLNNNISVKPFDILNIKIDLLLKKEEIFLNIDKIKIFFNSEINNDVNNKNYMNNYKEIKISNKLSKKNNISFNFNHLIKYSNYNYFLIDNISIYLENGNKININNIKIDNNIILYAKNGINEKIVKIIEDNNLDNKKIKVGEKENYFYCLNYQKMINNDNIIISKIIGKIELKEKEENKENKDIKENKEKKYYLKTVNIDNNSSNNESLITFLENKSFKDNDIHNYNFIIKINEIGEYILLYNLKFIIIHKECENESYTFEEKGKKKIECIKPFYFKNKLESSLYTKCPKDKQIIYPKNYPIKLNIIITNSLAQKIIIKNINFENISNNIKINSPILKIITKNKNNMILCPGEKFIIPNKLFINENIECTIGNIKIIWISKELDNFFQSKIFFNETIIELNKIKAKEIPFEINGDFIYENKKLIDNFLYNKLRIKNLNKNSRKIHCELLNENNIIEKNKKDIVSYGKTIINDIIFPQKEIYFLFHFYDKNKKKKNIDKIIIDSRYNNIIKIDEYNLENNNELDNNELENNTYLINQIFFVPELYSQFNNNNK